MLNFTRQSIPDRRAIFATVQFKTVSMRSEKSLCVTVDGPTLADLGGRRGGSDYGNYKQEARGAGVGSESRRDQEEGGELAAVHGSLGLPGWRLCRCFTLLSPFPTRPRP